MKRVIVLCVLVLSTYSLWAQRPSSPEDLQISKLLFLNTYPKEYDSKQVLLTGKAAAEYGLTLFSSLTLTPSEQDEYEIEQMVLADTEHAVTKEVGKKNLRLYYGFFALDNDERKYKRYIYYRNHRLFDSGKRHITLILMESKAGFDQIREMFKRTQ